MSHDDPELWLAHPHCSVRSESRCIIGAPRPPIAQRATDTKPSVVLLSPRSHRPQVEETSHPRSRSALSSCFPLFLDSTLATTPLGSPKPRPNERTPPRPATCHLSSMSMSLWSPSSPPRTFSNAPTPASPPLRHCSCRPLRSRSSRHLGLERTTSALSHEPAILAPGLGPPAHWRASTRSAAFMTRHPTRGLQFGLRRGGEGKKHEHPIYISVKCRAPKHRNSGIPENITVTGKP